MSQSDLFTRADALLDAALDVPTEGRTAWLDQACDGSPELRALVDRLILSAEQPTTDLLEVGGALRSDAAQEALQLPDLVGKLVGRYRIEKEVGRGGMGVVYSAHDTELERKVAVKLLSVACGDDVARERIQHEARLAASLNHPNIVAIHDLGEEQDLPYLVMELVPGRTLEHQPPIDLKETLQITLQLAEALKHAHERGVIHRDLKPGNVLVSREAGGCSVKLADLGIARLRGGSRLTDSGVIRGTPLYMSPDQAMGEICDGRSDLYSLGVMLYLWSVGRHPFDGDDALAVVSQHLHAPVVPPRTICPDVPIELEAIILRLLAKRPVERFDSASELIRALELVTLDAVGESEGAAESSGSEAIKGLTRGRLVGRREELDRLLGLWNGARESRSHLALVSGEPGVGKTRLSRELISRARLDGAQILAGGCYENEATTPYLPFVEAVRRFVSEQRNDATLMAILGDTAAELSRLAPEIDSRLGPFPERPDLSPDVERLRLFDHVAQFFRRLSEPRGLLVVLDDLQWADRGSLALLQDLMHQLKNERILFLGAYREIELDRAHGLSKAIVDWDRERSATRIRLDRLDREAAASLVETLLGQSELEADLLGALHRETEGNPFFLEEIVKAMVDDRALVCSAGRWRRRTSGELFLPQSVKAAIGGRLQRVSDGTNEVLRAAAVLGKQFDFEELNSITRIDEDALLDALDEAGAAQLILAGGGESFSFSHDKIREVLYEEMNPIRRRRLHAQIARGLESMLDGGASVAVEELAHHHIEGGNDDRGRIWAEKAADAACRVFAWDEASGMLERAIECAECLELPEDVARLRERLGDVESTAGNLLAAIASYVATLEQSSEWSASRQNELRCKAAACMVSVADPRGLEYAKLILAESSEQTQPKHIAVAKMAVARYAHLAGRLDEAEAGLREALTLAEPLDEPKLVVSILSFLSGSLQHKARFEESDAVATRCLEYGEQHSYPEGVMLGHEFMMENGIFRGFWKLAIEHGEKEEAHAVARRNRDRQSWARFRATAISHSGQLEAAQQLMKSTLQMCESTGEIRLALWTRIEQSTSLMFSGEFERAEQILDVALADADSRKLLSHRVGVRSMICQLRCFQRQHEGLAEIAREAINLCLETGSLGILLNYGVPLAKALVATGHLDEARAFAEKQRELAVETKATFRLAQNDEFLGLCAQADGNLPKAFEHFGEAIEGFERAESPPNRAVCLSLRAHVSRLVGQPQAAERDIQQAQQLMRECGGSTRMFV